MVAIEGFAFLSAFELSASSTPSETRGRNDAGVEGEEGGGDEVLV